MSLDKVKSGLRPDVYVGYLPVEVDEAAAAANTGVLFEETRPFDSFRASCLLAQPWPLELTADGVFWIDSQPDTCFKLRISKGQAAYRPLGKWMASRPRRERVDLERGEMLSGRKWHPVYGDRIQYIWFQGLDDGWEHYEQMFVRSLVKPEINFRD